MTTLHATVTTAAVTPEAHQRGPCWTWTNALTHNGYGRVHTPGHGMRRVHRVAYEAAIGPIPDGHVIDHVCRNRACWRPSHLRVTTIAGNNTADGSQWCGLRTHCPRGHPLEGDNLRPSKHAHGIRECLTCHRARARTRRQDDYDKAA